MSDPTDGSSKSSSPAFGERASEIIAGISLGLFVGIMLGMSVTPLVATVMGAFVAVLATFFGLADTSKTAPIRPAHQRIAAFCLAAILATLGGIYGRTHNLLSPEPDKPQPAQTMQAVVQELRDLKFPEDQVLALVKLRFFGVAPTGETIVEAPSPPTPAQLQASAEDTVLFSFEGTSDDCGQLSRYAVLPPDEQIVALKSVEGMAADLAKRVEELPEARQREALRAGRLLLCNY